MAYTSGKYRLLYYKEIERKDQVVRLEILQRARRADWTPKEIGELQALTLEIDGEDDPVAPIQKTLLSFSMVDTYDITDTDDVKHGSWEELYTPDSTLFMVVVKTRSKSGTAFSTRWSGYITPDNWEEELDYRGSITITARDNIGHLQDFDFDMPADANGTATIKDILDMAFFRVAFPMDVSYILTDSEEVVALKYDNTSLPDFRVNIAQFEGKTWYDAVESIMSSLGLCLRYVDYNRMSVTYLRYMPMLGTDLFQEVIHRPVIFLGGGKRVLDPAYKRIVEKVGYDFNETVSYNISKGINLSRNGTFSYKIEVMTGRNPEVFNEKGTAPIYANYNSEIEGWGPTGGFLNTADYEIGNDAVEYLGITKSNVVLLSANNTATDVHTYGFGLIHTPAGKIVINLAGQGLHVKGATITQRPYPIFLKSIKYSVRYDVGGKSYFWDGESWTDSSTELTFSTLSDGATTFKRAVFTESIEIDFLDPKNIADIAKDGALYLVLNSITVVKQPETKYADYNGCYLGIMGLSIDTQSPDKALKSDTVTTINNDLYNVTCSRSPDIGFLSRDVIWQNPQNYMNAVYYQNSEFMVQPVGYKLMWGNSTATEEPFPVILHRQILCYHRIASQVLDGECMREDNYGWSFDEILTYKGHKFILVKGVYDILSGVMSSATLREFEAYDDVWGTSQMTTTEN